MMIRSWIFSAITASTLFVGSRPSMGDSTLDRDRDTARVFLEQLYYPLKFRATPTIEVLDRKVFEQRQLAELAKEAPERQRDWKVLTSLGLIRGSEPAEKVLRKMMEKGLDGSYQFETRKIILPEGQAERPKVLVHEMTHQLMHEQVDVPALRKAVEKNDDRLSAYLAVTEGMATFAEVAFEAWQNDENRGDGAWKPSPEVFTRALQKARVDLAMIYSGSSDSIESDTIQRYVQFSYQHGLNFIASVSRDHANSLGPWFVTLHDLKRLPKSTREILHPGPTAMSVEIRPLSPMFQRMLEGTPWKVVEDGYLGDLTVRLWWRMDLTDGVQDERLPLGLSGDRLVVIEDASSGRLAGAALLVFDSVDQAIAASKLVARSTAAVGAGVERIDRVLVIPIGALPEKFRKEIVETSRSWAFPRPALPPAELARIRFGGYLVANDANSWSGFVKALGQCNESVREPILALLNESLFITAQPTTPEDLELEEDAFWMKGDNRQRELGQLAARDLPAMLGPEHRRLVTRAALAALADDETLPIAAANALRWIARTSRTDQVAPKEQAILRSAAVRLFPDQPGVISAVDRLVNPSQH
jgi:hypothetical protein